MVMPRETQEDCKKRYASMITLLITLTPYSSFTRYTDSNFNFCQFQYIEVRNKNTSTFMDLFTPHTVICVVQEGPRFPTGMMAINLKYAKEFFIKLEQEAALEQPSSPSQYH